MITNGGAEATNKFVASFNTHYKLLIIIWYFSKRCTLSNYQTSLEEDNVGQKYVKKLQTGVKHHISWQTN